MSNTWPAPPPTRILSWQQLVLEADPDWQFKLTRPWVYEMSSGRRFYAPNPLYYYGGTFLNDGGVLVFASAADAEGWPTSPTGLPNGAVYNVGLTVQIVGTSTYSGTPVYFGNIDPTSLLAAGAAGWPNVQGVVGSLQMYSNGGLACIS